MTTRTGEPSRFAVVLVRVYRDGSEPLRLRVCSRPDRTTADGYAAELAARYGTIPNAEALPYTVRYEVVEYDPAEGVP